MSKLTTSEGRVRVLSGDKIEIVSGSSLATVQSSITCNGGLPRPCSTSCGPPRPAPEPEPESLF